MMGTRTFNYGEYLASREWALLKEQVRKRSGGRCERCKQAPHENTHHLTYERIGHERLEDLLGVCRPCHEYLSGKTNADPAAQCEPLLATPIFEQGYGIEPLLLCPVCKFEYVHFSGAEWTAQGDDYEAGWVRGSVYSLKFWCENGHVFRLEFGQHKGYTFVRIAPRWEPLHEGVPTPPPQPVDKESAKRQIHEAMALGRRSVNEIVDWTGLPRGLVRRVFHNALPD